MKTMTLKEFNEAYYIEFTILAYQQATLHSIELEYGGVEGILEKGPFTVYNRETHENVYEIETDNDGQFIEAVKNKFRIVE